uniref:Uncharacterized protein n=1 Tax=Sphaerodactylus townsendi TaxID=933632 RepID=A0ACB8FZV8_9SAUR
MQQPHSTTGTAVISTLLIIVCLYRMPVPLSGCSEAQCSCRFLCIGLCVLNEECACLTQDSHQSGFRGAVKNSEMQEEILEDLLAPAYLLSHPCMRTAAHMLLAWRTVRHTTASFLLNVGGCFHGLLCELTRGTRHIVTEGKLDAGLNCLPQEVSVCGMLFSYLAGFCILKFRLCMSNKQNKKKAPTSKFALVQRELNLCLDQSYFGDLKIVGQGDRQMPMSSSHSLPTRAALFLRHTHTKLIHKASSCLPFTAPFSLFLCLHAGPLL